MATGENDLMDASRKDLGTVIKEVYLNHEGTRLPVMVGYDVRDLISLEEMGYRIERSSEDDYHKARKHGLVYIKGEM